MKNTASMSALLLGLMLTTLQAPHARAAGDSSALPPVSADGVMSPLKREQLNDKERAVFDAIPSGSEEATRYLYTRGFLRYCKLLVDGAIDVSRLPQLPIRRNWNRAHLSPTEAQEIVDVALGMKLLSGMQQPSSSARSG